MLYFSIVFYFIIFSYTMNTKRYEKYVSWSNTSVDFNYIETLIENWPKTMFEIIEHYIISFYRNKIMFCTMTTGRCLGTCVRDEKKTMFLQIVCDAGVLPPWSRIAAVTRVRWWCLIHTYTHLWHTDTLANDSGCLRGTSISRAVLLLLTWAFSAFLLPFLCICKTSKRMSK